MANPVWIDGFNKPLTDGARTRSPQHVDRQRANRNVALRDGSRSETRRNGIEPIKSVRYDSDLTGGLTETEDS